MSELKIRCSSLGKVVQLTSLTDNQLKTIAEMEAKRLEKGLTQKQSETLQDLTYRRDNPELTTGAKTFLRENYSYKKFRDKENIFIKEAQKGIMMEDVGIELIDEVLFGGVGLVKNTVSKSDEFIEGTCDIDYEDWIIDNKSPWSSKQFYQAIYDPINTDYLWQIKGYCRLYNKQSGVLAYTLVDTPSYASLQASFRGMSLDTIEWETEYDQPSEERVFAVNIPIEDSDDKQIETSVRLARDYVNYFDGLVKSRIGNVNTIW
jgi:hypothetical protein